MEALCFSMELYDGLRSQLDISMCDEGGTVVSEESNYEATLLEVR